MELKYFVEKIFLKLKASTYVSLSTGVIFLLAAMMLVLIIYRDQQNETLDCAQEKAFMMLDQNIAIHTYYSKELKPGLFKLIEPLGIKDYFEPSWMSSTYAIRQIEGYSELLRKEGYYYKECAINARSPMNEADDFEREFIQRLNKEPELMKWSGNRKFDGKDFFVLLQRGETMEESCLRCHSTPDRAPGDMVARYGAERSFNRDVDEVVSAISIRIPISQAKAAAIRYSFGLIVLVLSVLAAIFAVHYLLNNSLLIGPLNRIQEKVCDITNNTDRLGEKIPLPKGRELQELVLNFNQMSVSLRNSHDNLERQVKQRTAELTQANKEMENLLRIVSHDLRAPLCNVEGFTHAMVDYSEQLMSLLDTAADSPSQQDSKEIRQGLKECRHFINTSVCKMDKLLKGLSSLANLGRVELKMEALDMNKLMASVVGAIKRQVDESGAKVHIDTLPECTGDETQINQVFSNLLGNALKYRHPERSPEIHISGQIEKGMSVYTIRDNGLGIPEEHLDKVFDIYHRVDPGGAAAGDGLGLTAVKKIIERHKGTINLQSQVSIGTIFNIAIPTV